MISKEAREAATEEICGRFNDDYVRGFAVQSLLDAQKLDSEKKLAEVREFAANAAIDITKGEATITELRAACAEKDAALKNCHPGIIWDQARMFYQDKRRDDTIRKWHSARCAQAHQALSSHGESILAEVARLKEERDEWHKEAAQYLTDSVKLTAGFNDELSGLRARAESAEKALRELSEVEGIAGTIASKALASQPPQQGDKAP